MTSLVLTLSETLRYRGAIGQWSWVLHRLSGLGVVLFLTLHVIDTSWSVFYPELYVRAIASYQSPLFTIGEFGLVAAVVYHAYNGLRIVIFDYRPRWWKYQQKGAYIVLVATGLTLVPVFLLMFSHVLHYYEGNPQVLPLLDVIKEQLPFLVGFVVAGIAAVLLALITSPFIKEGGSKTQERRIERFWWSFMRVSGALIVPLVFGHLIMMHVIQGVFDLTVAGHFVVGTDAQNVSGTAVEFVANRWNHLIGPVAIWRIYDLALLGLVTLHGFNGLRLVLTDYTMSNKIARRAAVYLCVIGAVALLVVGGAALLSTIEPQAISLAEEAMRNLHH